MLSGIGLGRLKRWEAYAVSLLVTAVALGLRFALDGELAGNPTLVIFIVPIMIAAIVGGLRAGLFATLLSYIAATSFPFFPDHSLVAASRPERWDQLFFVLSGVGISLMVKVLEHAKNNTERLQLQHAESAGEIAQANRALIKVAAAVSAATGAEFFEQLARNMAEALQAEAAFVAEMLPGGGGTARTVAAVVDGNLTENFDYVIAGTPCAGLLTSDSCVIAEGVAEQFPQSAPLASLRAQGYVGRRLDDSSGKPLGILFVIFRSPVKRVEFVTSTLQIFAARAASELERQQSEGRLREQAALLDVAHEAIVLRDLDGQIQYWNKGAERIFGSTSEEVVGKKWFGLLHDGFPRYDEAVAAVLSDSEWRGETVKQTRDGRTINVETQWTLVRDSRNMPKSILVMSSDVTQKKLLESQFRRAQRMESIGTLAGGIAHDLNNVLTPILMSLETLRGAVTRQEDIALIRTLEVSAQRGADLVKQVLSFARGVESQRMPVDPANLIDQLLGVVRETFPKSITLSFAPSPDLWTVSVDPTQMHQVFMNLCVNARDAMPAGGTLAVKMENVFLNEAPTDSQAEFHSGAFVRIDVEDTGTGMSPEIRERIFEPFFTTKEIGKGTGLGLSTALTIVKSHGGFIRLCTERAIGTGMQVYLRASSVDCATPPVALQADALPRGNGELILVVDDEAAIRKVAKRMLERFGYRVMLAADGEEAVAIYARHRSDIAVVLTDMAMPVMDGPATILALKAMNLDVKIIASSGLSSFGGLDKAIASSVQQFVAKPYTAEAMLRALQEMLAAPAFAGRVGTRIS